MSISGLTQAGARQSASRCSDSALSRRKRLENRPTQIKARLTPGVEGLPLAVARSVSVSRGRVPEL
jgi:hypothetical protein